MNYINFFLLNLYGIVFKSNPDSENQEVYNKIEALRKAIKTAEKI